MFLAALWSTVEKRADLLAFVYVVFSCVFVTFPFGVLGVLGQVCYSIVSIPDLFLLPYFKCNLPSGFRGVNVWKCYTVRRRTDAGVIGIGLAYPLAHVRLMFVCLI